MSNYNFDFFVDKKNMCSIGFSKNGIIFNKEIIKALGFPEKICIGIDKENKVLAVVADSSNIQGKRFAFVNKESKKKWLRIQSKPLIKAIEEMLGKQLDKKSVYYNVKIAGFDTSYYIIEF